MDAELREPLLHQAAAEPRAREVALALPRRLHAGPDAAGDAAPSAAERGEPGTLPGLRREGELRLRVPPVGFDDRVLHGRGAGPRPRGGPAAPGGGRDRRGPGRARGPGGGAGPARRDRRRPALPGRRLARAGSLRQGARPAGGVERRQDHDRDRGDRLSHERRPHHGRSRRPAARSPPTPSSWRPAPGHRTWRARSGCVCRSSRRRATA